MVSNGRGFARRGVETALFSVTRQWQGKAQSSASEVTKRDEKPVVAAHQRGGDGLIQKHGFRVRIYPNAEQTAQIEKTIDCSRFVFNKMLEVQQKVYRRRGEHLSNYDMQKMLTKMKEQYSWLKDVDSRALKEACTVVALAYEAFFRRLKQGKRPGFPKFKSRKKAKLSYVSTNGSTMHIDSSRIKLPIVGWIKASVPRIPQGKICRVIVTKTKNPLGKKSSWNGFLNTWLPMVRPL